MDLQNYTLVDANTLQRYFPAEVVTTETRDCFRLLHLEQEFVDYQVRFPITAESESER